MSHRDRELGGNRVVEWAVHPAQHLGMAQLGQEAGDRLVEGEQTLVDERHGGRGRDRLGGRRDPEERIASHVGAADGQRAADAVMLLVPPGDQGHQPRNGVVAHVVAGHGVELAQTLGGQLGRHPGSFSRVAVEGIDGRRTPDSSRCRSRWSGERDITDLAPPFRRARGSPYIAGHATACACLGCRRVHRRASGAPSGRRRVLGPRGRSEGADLWPEPGR